VWECGEEQTDTQTDTQTAVINVRFASAMPHAKCNYIATTTSSQQLESRQSNIESIFAALICLPDTFLKD